MKTKKEIFAFFSLENKGEEVYQKIYDDSREVQKGSIFLAIGKGNRYVEQARNKGAFILSDQEIPSLSKCLLDFSLWFYDHPEHDIELIGITGTNGKSTTASMVHQLLPHSFLISNVPQDHDTWVIRNTTPYPLSFVKALCEAKKRKKRYVILEVSSIAIAEKRLFPLQFQVLALTNLTSDHLDYHHTLENYQNTKIDFINSQCAEKFIFYDSNILRKITTQFVPVHSFPILKEGRNTTSFIVEDRKVIRRRYLPEYHLYNLAIAYAIARYYHQKRQRLYHKMRKISLPKGRHEIVMRKPRIIVDYAHTASAFEEMIAEAKRTTKGKLYVVFGAGGQRDKSKRALYGEYAFRYADYAVVSNDNPRYEDPKEIVHDIIAEHPDFFHIEYDRRRAIDQVLLLAKKEDTVLLVGRGHETIQSVQGRDIFLSDQEEVKKWRHMR